MNFLKTLIKEIGDEHASLAEDGTSSAEFTGYVDTGSLIFNAALSGTIFGGMPNNKILGLAGEQAVGKTFFALGIVQHFIDTHKQAGAAWYMSEPAVTKKMLEDRSINPNQVMFAEPQTVEQWRTAVLQRARRAVNSTHFRLSVSRMEQSFAISVDTDFFSMLEHT